MNKSDKVYQDLLKDILENGVRKSDRTGTGTISVFGRQVRFNMQEGFPLLTTKKMFTKGIVHELLWFLKGDTNIKYLVDNGVNIWNGDAYRAYTNRFAGYEDAPSIEWFVDEIKNNEEFAKKFGDLGSIYGKQWVDWGGFYSSAHWNSKTNSLGIHFNGVNQIQNAINELKNNPDSRRIMVNAWNVGEIKDMVLPPCHYGFQLYTRELSLEERRKLVNRDSEFISPMTVESWDRANIPTRAISLMWNQRSVDTFLGLPFNIASYGILLHMFAQQLNMVPDELIGNLGDVHIYTNHLEQVNIQLTREPKKLCTLALSKAKDIFSYCYEDINFIDYESHPTIKGELST